MDLIHSLHPKTIWQRLPKPFFSMNVFAVTCIAASFYIPTVAIANSDDSNLAQPSAEARHTPEPHKVEVDENYSDNTYSDNNYAEKVYVEKVYVENADGTYLSTRGNEHCSFHEAHDHVHCYAKDPTANTLSTRRSSADATVIVEQSNTYRHTRHYQQTRLRDYRSNPIATGIGVGLAIGIPVLIHNELRTHRKHHRYSGGRWNNYGHSHYRKNRYGYRDKSYSDRSRYRGKHRRKARAYLY